MDETGETLEDFKNSFSYGSRSDLSFKFLKGLSADEAGEVIQDVLREVGALFDSGDPTDLLGTVVSAQAAAYGRNRPSERYVYASGPFTPMTVPVPDARVLLLTSSGHFVDGDDPEPFGVESMTQEEAEERIQEFLREAPTLSTIPIDTRLEDLRVRHGGYDIRGAEADPNVAFPIALLREMEADGAIGSVYPDAFSFVGATAQMRVVRERAPEWADMVASTDADLALLVPV